MHPVVLYRTACAVVLEREVVSDPFQWKSSLRLVIGVCSQERSMPVRSAVSLCATVTALIVLAV
jgi:hypothetical protein